MKYKLNMELSKLARKKAPANIYIYPLVNLVLQMYSCKSDDKVSVTKYYTPGYEGSKLSTFVIEPKHYSGKLPCVMFYHGGGFLLKASKTHYQIAKWYAEKAKCKVVFTDYRLLPKYVFPIAIEDCFSTYLWVLNNSDKLDVNEEKIIVAGDSAGANISVAVSMMAKDRKVIPPIGTLLVYPVVDRRMHTESMKNCMDTPVWDSKRNAMFWKAYLKEYSKEQLKYASPMEAESLKNFPETYIEVAEYDCLHDEGIAFSERLISDGVVVEVHEVKGTCHGFEDALKSTIVKNCIERRIKWIQKVYG